MTTGKGPVPLGMYAVVVKVSLEDVIEKVDVVTVEGPGLP